MRSLFLTALLLPSLVLAQEEPVSAAPVAGGGGPPSMPGASGDDLLASSSPFTRTLNLSDDLILTGYATVDGQPIVTLINKETRETFVVSNKPNFQGWQMIEIDTENGIERAQAKVSIEGQVVTIRFDEEAMIEAVKKRGGPGGGGGTGGSDRGGDRDGRGRGGPSEEMRNKFMTLSEDQRNKFRDYMMKNREKMSKMSHDDRGKHISGLLDKITR